MNREQLRSKILREVVILYFDHLLKGEDVFIDEDLYDSFFYKWYKKLLSEDVNVLSTDELDTFKDELENIIDVYHAKPTNAQKLSIHDLNHSLTKYISLQQSVVGNE